MKQKREKRVDGYWLLVLVSILASVLIGFQSANHFSTGSIVYNPNFMAPQKCLFVSDCNKVSLEKGIPLTCRLAFSSAREKSCLPPLLENMRCTASEDCAVGLTCVKSNTDALHAICTHTPRTLGETCQKREDCGENTACILLQNASAMTC